MKINKKVVITVAMVLIVAVCGIIVYNVNYVPKMLVGSIYNGLTLRSVTDHSNEFAAYDINIASPLEKEIAENTSVIISAMTLTSDDAGTVTLRIVSPDIKTALEGLAVDVANDDKADFADALSEELLLMFKNNSVSKRAEPFFVDADMKFVSNTWIIVPDDELFNALTADVNNLIDELYCAN